MKSALMFLFLLGFTVVFGQKSIDLANVYWRTSPFNSFPQTDNYTRNFNMYVADMKLPIVLDDNNILLLGAEYQQSQITTKPDNFLYNDYSFASTMLQIGWKHSWDKSDILIMAIPRFNTDYNGIKGNHFQLGGLVLANTKRSEKFTWKYGMYYNGELFGPMIVPLFGFNWDINEKLQFKLTIPLNFEFSYQANNWFRTGARFDGFNSSYAYQAIPGLAGSEGYIDKADNNVWGFAEFQFAKNVWFHVRAGHSILRKYRFFTEGDKMGLKIGPVNVGDDRNNNDPKAVPFILKEGMSFELRLTYRLPI